MVDFVTNIQWKGTDFCMDFVCPECKTQEHFDGFFWYEIECPNCKACWKMPTDIWALMERVTK